MTQDRKRQRSVNIDTILKAATSTRKQAEQGTFRPHAATREEATNADKPGPLFAEYVTAIGWPTWRDQHPDQPQHR